MHDAPIAERRGAQAAVESAPCAALVNHEAVANVRWLGIRTDERALNVYVLADGGAAQEAWLNRWNREHQWTPVRHQLCGKKRLAWIPTADCGTFQDITAAFSESSSIEEKHCLMSFYTPELAIEACEKSWLPKSRCKEIYNALKEKCRQRKLGYCDRLL